MSEAQEPRNQTTRPALDVLDRDQDRLLYDGDQRRDPPIIALADGFPTFWMALSWYQAAGVRTLGHVEKVLRPADMMPESSVMEHLIHPSESSESDYVRLRLVESLDDACEQAYRQFRQRAEERTATPDSAVESYERIDPEKEENPLMRPAFRKMDAGQAGVLERLWLGFGDRREIGQWCRSLTSVSHAEKPEGLVDDIISSGPLLAALLDTESESARLTRYRFAVGEVLPAFLAAARTLRGSERSETTQETGGWKQA